MTSTSRQIPLFKVHMPASVGAALEHVLHSGFINEGIQVTQFEAALRDFFDNQLTIAVNSGTAAITLALRLAGVGPGDEVISSPMTCVATNTPIANLFAKPVWCDIDPDTGNIDPERISSLVTERTKAILFVDWAGIPADLARIAEVGKAHNLPVIEDAAHAFGAEFSGRKVGAISDFTVFSFQAIKHVSTGDGGALSMLSSELFARAKKLKWFGIDREATKDSAGNWKGSRWDCDIPEAGYKFHMNNLQAAIGLEQMKHAHDIVRRHRQNAARLMAGLTGVPGLSLPVLPTNCNPSWWVAMVFAERRDELSKKLTESGVHNSLLHVRNDLYECFSSSKTLLPGVSAFEKKEICLPCGWWVSDDDVDYIIKCIRSGW